MNGFSVTSMVTTVAALVTTIVLFAWAKLDKKSNPWSGMAAGWTGTVFVVFTVLWLMSLDGYQNYDLAFMSNAIPGVVLWSLISLFVIGVNEIRMHLKDVRHGCNS